jgi:hypothetical protein
VATGRSSRASACSSKEDSPSTEPDRKYRNRMATSRRAEPAMVNRKNFTAAYTRRS